MRYMKAVCECGEEIEVRDEGNGWNYAVCKCGRTYYADTIHDMQHISNFGE